MKTRAKHGPAFYEILGKLRRQFAWVSVLPEIRMPNQKLLGVQFRGDAEQVHALMASDGHGGVESLMGGAAVEELSKLTRCCNHDAILPHREEKIKK